MLRKWNLNLALASCMLLVLPQAAQAFNGIMKDWQDYYTPCAPLIAADCNACHMNGFDFNPYGDDIKTRLDQGMTNIEAFVAVEGMDSDGDTFSNGQEIVIDCTLPGDDTSLGTVAVAVTSWSQIKALFR